MAAPAERLRRREGTGANSLRINAAVQFLRSDGTWSWGTLDSFRDFTATSDMGDPKKRRIGATVSFTDPSTGKDLEKLVFIREKGVDYMREIPAAEWDAQVAARDAESEV